MKTNEIKLIKSFMALQENICQEKKKLCDKYHNLELSHNRKIKALEKIRQWATEMNYTGIQAICDNALFCNSRERNKICHG